MKFDDPTDQEVLMAELMHELIVFGTLPACVTYMKQKQFHKLLHLWCTIEDDAWGLSGIEYHAYVANLESFPNSPSYLLEHLETKVAAYRRPDTNYWSHVWPVNREAIDINKLATDPLKDSGSDASVIPIKRLDLGWRLVG